MKSTFFIWIVVIAITISACGSKTPSVQNSNFGEAVKEFEITVPLDYKHEEQISLLVAKMKEAEMDTSMPSRYDGLTDENFSRVSAKLKPGEAYKVRIYSILPGKNNSLMVTSVECLEFLKSQGAILTGAQGLSLAYRFNSDKFPERRWVMSFDEKDALWKNERGEAQLPVIFKDGAGNMGGLSTFDDDTTGAGSWSSAYCLIAFFEK